jgi:hypothetical protein
VGFDIIDQLLVRLFLHSSKTGEEMEVQWIVHQLFIEIKKACDLVGREVLYNILIEFAEAVKLVRIIKMCSKETCSSARVSKYLSDNVSY